MKILNLILFLFVCSSSYSKANYKLPEYVLVDINKIVFTYALLDSVSDSVFIGWNNFREVPISISYENGLEILIGFPELQGNYFNCESLIINGKSIFVDTSNVTELVLDNYSILTGAASPIGNANKKTIWGLHLRSHRISNSEQDQIYNSIDMEISTLIHELTHSLQQSLKLQFKSPNFNFDTNLDYVIFSTLEGLALKKAYIAKDSKSKKELLRDFLIFRKEKRKSMDSLSILSESHAEFTEGMAVYAERRVNEILQNNKNIFENLKQKYKMPKALFNRLTELEDYLDSLFEKQIYESYNSRTKVYFYGYVQAKLCNDLYGTTAKWYIDKNYSYYDAIIQSNLYRDENLIETLKNEYNYTEVYNYHYPIIHSRDSIIHIINNQIGIKYILNFKPMEKMIFSLLEKNFPYMKYNNEYYLDKNIGEIKFDKIKINFHTSLSKILELYKLELFSKSKNDYEFDYSKKENNIYYGVKIKTPIFDLEAPKINITEDDKSILIEILSSI
ncbi:MAG: hypothetical protein H6609_18005 [Ignavibacteriales bacterium]|nr:hypothetical protein [Ignavibacteriales bacterium]